LHEFEAFIGKALKDTVALVYRKPLMKQSMSVVDSGIDGVVWSRARSVSLARKTGVTYSVQANFDRS
jgi:hypothetical protein